MQALTGLHDALMANEDQMYSAVSRLQQQVDSYRTKKEAFRPAYTAAEAESIRETMTALSGALNGFGMTTRRAKDRTTYMQPRAGVASDELAPQRSDDVTSQPLVDIDAELERLKREIEDESTAPLPASPKPGPLRVRVSTTETRLMPGLRERHGSCDWGFASRKLAGQRRISSEGSHAGPSGAVMDTPELSIRELDALFEQSPVAMVFIDTELRARRANAAFRELMGFPEGELLGQPPTRQPGISQILDTAFVERTMAEQVIKEGVPVVNAPLELTVAGERRVAAWTAYRVTEGSRVIGVVSTLIDITGRAKAGADLRRTNMRLDLLQRAASEIGTTLDIRRTAEELVALATPGLADRASVDLIELALRGEDPAVASPGQLSFRRYALRDTATPDAVNYTVGQQYTVPVNRQPAVVYLRGEPILARSPQEMAERDLPSAIVQPLIDRGAHTAIQVPLTARGVTLGVAAFVRSKTPQPYDEADVRLMCDLTARAAVHIDNARLYSREHEAAVTLQRSLLPRDIPQVPGLDIAWRYEPASQAAEIGGDWFDVIRLDDGQVALVVGDVTGHGIRAAAIMGQLRTTITALAHLGCPPAQILRQLSDTVAAFGDEAGATCVHALYDPASRRCGLTGAGHPSPVLRHPDGTTELIDLPAGPLLGAAPGPYLTVGWQLAPGTILALYTDGLIERPGEDLAIGMSRLTRALADGPGQSLDELCDSVLAALSPYPRDDVALLLARSTTRA